MRSTTMTRAGRDWHVPTGGVAKAATADAQLAFLRSSLPRVYGWLLARCGDRALAEDLLGETVVAAARLLRQSPSTQLTTAWLLAVARNKYVDNVRRSVREQRTMARMADEVGAREGPDDDWLPGATRERTLAALAAVPAAQRGVLALHYLDEMPVADVAETIGRSVHATESLLARGRNSFRSAFQREVAGDD